MTNEEYKSVLRSHGFSIHKICGGEVRTLILQGRDRGCFASAPHPDDLGDEERVEELAKFVKTNCGQQ